MPDTEYTFRGCFRLQSLCNNENNFLNLFFQKHLFSTGSGKNFVVSFNHFRLPREDAKQTIYHICTMMDTWIRCKKETLQKYENLLCFSLTSGRPGDHYLRKISVITGKRKEFNRIIQPSSQLIPLLHKVY